MAYVSDVWADQLPADVLIKIYRLVSLTDRLKASAACRRWRQCVWEPCVWRTVRFRFLTVDKSLAHLTDITHVGQFDSCKKPTDEGQFLLG